MCKLVLDKVINEWSGVLRILGYVDTNVEDSGTCTNIKVVSTKTRKVVLHHANIHVSNYSI